MSYLKYLFKEGLCSLVVLFSGPGWEEGASFHCFQQRNEIILISISGWRWDVLEEDVTSA